MTAQDSPTADVRRRARITSSHGDHETATQVAAALSPDNTAEMETTVTGQQVVTTITRDATGSLQSTADDYVVNLQLAAQLATQDRASSTSDSTAGDHEPGAESTTSNDT